MPRPLCVIAWCVLLLGSVSARGEIYKCTDASGAVQFSDRPCTGVSTLITRKKSPPDAQSPDEHMQKTRRLLDALQEERDQAKQEQAQQQAAAEKRKRNCVTARDDLRNITQASRLYRLDEAGNRVILSDEERTRATGETQAKMAHWCD
jgi:hypothetical protein